MTITADLAPQNLKALSRANAIRLARAGLKHRVGAGTITAASVILEPPEEAQSMAIAELLCSQRRWGAHRCARFLAEFGIGEARTLGKLTERQRQLLADALARSTPRPCFPPPHATQPR